MTKAIQLISDAAPMYEPGELRRHVLQRVQSCIGMTAEQITDTWRTQGIPETVIDSGKWDTKEDFVCVMLGQVGTPLIECTLDSSGKCLSQSLSIYADEVALCMGRIRELGFTYSARNKRWTRPETHYTWRIEESAKDRFAVTLRRFKPVNP